jgi:hypothetical protein
MRLLRSVLVVAALGLAGPVWADGGHGHGHGRDGFRHDRHDTIPTGSIIGITPMPGAIVTTRITTAATMRPIRVTPTRCPRPACIS